MIKVGEEDLDLRWPYQAANGTLNELEAGGDILHTDHFVHIFAHPRVAFSGLLGRAQTDLQEPSSCQRGERVREFGTCSRILQAITATFGDSEEFLDDEIAVFAVLA